MYVYIFLYLMYMTSFIQIQPINLRLCNEKIENISICILEVLTIIDIYMGLKK